MYRPFPGSVAKDGCRTGSISPLLGCGESGESIDDLYTLSGFFTLIIGNRSIDMPAQVVGRHGNSFHGPLVSHSHRRRFLSGLCAYVRGEIGNALRCFARPRHGHCTELQTSKSVSLSGGTHKRSQARAIDFKRPELEGNRFCNHGLRVNGQASKGLPSNRSMKPSVIVMEVRVQEYRKVVLP